jgi:hypothetical protein
MKEIFQQHDTDFKLIKLVNGEDIICSINDGNPNTVGGKIEVIFPLKMQVVPKMTNGGINESLNLSHWVHPYTETKSFHIPTSSILLVANVSPGLSRYYEYVLKQIEKEGEVEPLEEPTDDDLMDEIFDEFDTGSESIH